jgi:hypothetical protein
MASRRSQRDRHLETPQDRLLRAGEIAAAPTIQRKKQTGPPTSGARADALKKQQRKVSVYLESS